MTVTLTSTTENARQVVLDGYVCGFEDGDHVGLFWVATGLRIHSQAIVEAILALVANEEAVFTDDAILRGLYRLELVETEQLIDCN